MWKDTLHVTEEEIEDGQVENPTCCAVALAVQRQIIPELPGAAHRFPLEQASVIKKTLVSNLESLKLIEIENLIKNIKIEIIIVLIVLNIIL